MGGKFGVFRLPTITLLKICSYQCLNEYLTGKFFLVKFSYFTNQLLACLQSTLMELSVLRVLRFIENLALSFRIYEVLVSSGLARSESIHSCDINFSEHH